MPRFPRGVSTQLRSITAFVNKFALWAEYIGTENNNNKDDNNYPFPTAKSKKSSITAITHNNHLALV